VEACGEDKRPREGGEVPSPGCERAAGVGHGASLPHRGAQRLPSRHERLEVFALLRVTSSCFLSRALGPHQSEGHTKRQNLGRCQAPYRRATRRRPLSTAAQSEVRSAFHRTAVVNQRGFNAFWARPRLGGTVPAHEMPFLAFAR
jgi:hypothetical protein